MARPVSRRCDREASGRGTGHHREATCCTSGRDGPDVALTSRNGANGDPRTDLQVQWVSLRPDIASIDETGFVVGQAIGTATIQVPRSATSRRRPPWTSSEIPCASCRLLQRRLACERATSSGSRPSLLVRPMPACPPSRAGRSAGQERRSKPTAASLPKIQAPIRLRRSSATESAPCHRHRVPRDVTRELEVVGRPPQEEFQAPEQWIMGDCGYLSSLMAGRLWVYDISDRRGPSKWTRSPSTHASSTTQHDR